MQRLTSQHRRFSTSPGPRPGDVENLLEKTRPRVAATLTKGRMPLAASAISELLGRVLQARLDATTRAEDPAASSVVANLAVAEQSLRARIDGWSSRRSHLLEWTIIALITGDIFLHLP